MSNPPTTPQAQGGSGTPKAESPSELFNRLKKEGKSPDEIGKEVKKLQDSIKEANPTSREKEVQKLFEKALDSGKEVTEAEKAAEKVAGKKAAGKIIGRSIEGLNYAYDGYQVINAPDTRGKVEAGVNAVSFSAGCEGSMVAAGPAAAWAGLITSETGGWGALLVEGGACLVGGFATSKTTDAVASHLRQKDMEAKIEQFDSFADSANSSDMKKAVDIQRQQLEQFFTKARDNGYIESDQYERIKQHIESKGR